MITTYYYHKYQVFISSETFIYAGYTKLILSSVIMTHCKHLLMQISVIHSTHAHAHIIHTCFEYTTVNYDVKGPDLSVADHACVRRLMRLKPEDQIGFSPDDWN